jgi:hypothetical protein
MIDLHVATVRLTGAWRLARLDPGGLRYFDATVEGFWQSFQAAIIAAPIYALLVLLRVDEHPLSSDPFRALLIEGIGYVISWTAFPLAVWYLTRALNVSQRYFAYMVAYNWAVVLQVLAYLPVAALAALGIIPAGLVTILALAVTAAVLYYQFFIARTALQVDVLPALGIVVLDFTLGILLDTIETAMQLQ